MKLIILYVLHIVSIFIHSWIYATNFLLYAHFFEAMTSSL